MSAGHTPGPWRLDGDHGYGNLVGHRVQTTSEPEYIVAVTLADVDQLASETEANARLIAAAPDLLEALREAKGLADMAVMSDDLDGTPSEDQAALEKLRAKIDAAISRATGEQEEGK